MDRVFIEGLEVDTVIGVYDWERGIRQCLRLDLDLGWDIRPAAADDDIAKALDYAVLSERIGEFARDAHFQLVETFAERLAALLMGEFGIRWLRLRVTKPGAVAAAAGVGVEIERGCR
ncbi:MULTISPECIES: dihydroneopterin aldolase [Pseudomonas]|uniref:7,8-dihydroneopterin aldolase n=1 Tax=Pseudomonas citronellolis TaxID=53408 RepID=A0AAW6P2Y0_9PSED|nr:MULTISPECIES: dihydroneopterin aldolase [Pseudomonas]KSW24477.1 dihydroneopterin aldolase [Pseudomonas sp. ADP]NTX92668.1 dihydroneopterin aldolase [Pseudomonas sp. UMA643]NTY21890.1 dihydroneopterin aldolase [Pseudomonas sp. UMC3103]NTY28033.1 dihydroneopterin aldolase [Pseudomonas sp. UMA603]NTY32773.1 dihydroneopterin aldolase [Pseudomonas sp. UMC3129]NTY56954.1 dihydroneopterin aldolase [Pseudomonas sp. UMC631]NUA34614.1 dihydroneopterin aldolase [Pseudomonas sp. UMA601]